MRKKKELVFAYIPTTIFCFYIILTNPNFVFKVGWGGIFLGVTFNFLCVVFNNGRMPIPIGGSDKKHFVHNNKNEVKLWYFSDIIMIKGGLTSIGDTLMFSSFILVMIGITQEILEVILWDC